MIGRFWVVHHRFFGEVTGFDGRLLGLNIFYLAWIVLVPFSSAVLGDHGGETAAIVLYAVNLAGVVLVGMLMFGDAHRAGLADAPARAGAGISATARCSSRRSSSLSIPVALVAAAACPVRLARPVARAAGARRGDRA